MLRLRLIAAALIFNGDRLLMMKRSPERTLSPGMWAAVGGHLEPAEIGDPHAAVLREIYEETGLAADRLEDLTLRYILIRQNGNEIRQQFFYTARTRETSLTPCAEGTLHWIPREQVLEREMPFVFRKLLEHFFESGPCRHVEVGTAGLDGNEAVIRWVPLADPRV